MTDKNNSDIMTPEYFTEAYMDSIAPYIAPLDTEARTVYVEEGEECIPLRAEHGVDAPAFLSLVKNIGIYLNASTGSGFTSDYQKIQVTDTITLYSFQLPGGGNLNVFDTPDGKMVLDTGYGCFYKDCEKMLESLGLDGFFDTRVVICTHGDADHCGASGYFAVKPLMHPTTKELLNVGTRGYGSPNGLEVLEAFYTTTINTFSRMNVPEDVIECETMPVGHRGLFPVLGSLSFAGMEFEIWESLGGHIAGQLFLYEPKLGLLFTSDALINFQTLSKERADYSSIADAMIGSVNVRSDTARVERRELTRIAAELDAEMREKGKRLYICCGHGAISVLDENNRLQAVSEPVHYQAA